MPKSRGRCRGALSHTRTTSRSGGERGLTTTQKKITLDKEESFHVIKALGWKTKTNDCSVSVG